MAKEKLSLNCDVIDQMFAAQVSANESKERIEALRPQVETAVEELIRQQGLPKNFTGVIPYHGFKIVVRRPKSYTWQLNNSISNDPNLDYYKQLTMYILAGQRSLQQAREVTLPQMRATAAETGLASDAQKANDYANMVERFEKKLHDLELTRMICLQMGPQIRMIQNNDTLMTEKIQTSLVSTIPLWKSQMVLALGIHDSQQALQAQQQVTAVTNELLKKNADMLKDATIATAKESERGVVDIETLQHTNQQLISTLDEVLQIQTEGAQRRAAAEVELRRIEGELKEKLLQARGR